ncbi:MAG: DUF192 domain-containing protein [Dehalococcoidia bacterium]|nr:DUF192 domain-containing protein [Dehalococcoidia bacterium]
MTPLKVMNVTRQTCLVSRGKRATTPWARGIGLLRRGSLPEGDGLLIVPCKAITSLLMRFSFDAIFLDRQWRVVHILPDMPPNRLSSPVVRAAYAVLEVPAGTAARTLTQVGDQLEVLD